MPGLSGDAALTETLGLAVPFWMAGVRLLGDEGRARLASAMASIVSHQGDALLFGSRRQFGDGARQLARHRPKVPLVRRCPDQGCWCNRGGQPSYSAGEVLTALAKGLACAAYQPGGATFAGRHWCAAPHDGCPSGGAG